MLMLRIIFLLLSFLLLLSKSLISSLFSHNSSVDFYFHRKYVAGDDCECHPLGFLLGLPFAFVSLLLSLVGVVIWIVGIVLSCICPCCICVTVIVEMALGLIKAPFSVMKWFTEQIPC